MSITRAESENAELLASIVSLSNKDVAQQFGLTQINNPKHPSFYTPNWVLSDFERGEEYFIFNTEGVGVGCVAFESPDPNTTYLNRLSVLPTHRRQGIGESLVKYIIEYSKSKKISNVSIGIIADHMKLKEWYLKLGFVEVETKRFPHLPFEVTYLNFPIHG